MQSILLIDPPLYAREQSSSAARAGHWRVIHACEDARDILPMVEGQVAVGMRPYIVTPDGAGSAEFYLARKDTEQPASLSLLRAWQDVRNWRKSFLECNSESASDLVHTHSFAAGMAAVRNLPCVVHDFKACIEEFAVSTGLCEPGSWMGRSFRVAEQFILSRAQAVIVHSQGMKAAAEERGALPENVFLIPDPLPESDNDSLPLRDHFLQERFKIPPEAVTYFVPAADHANTESPSAAMMAVMEAFSLTLADAPNSVLLLEAHMAMIPAIQGHIERLGIKNHVGIVEAIDALPAMQMATVVIATAELPEDPVKLRQTNEICLRAMARGKPLLAADVARNRDSSPQGRGCLWFNDSDIRDLAYRMGFLACNPDFRIALGASALGYILETRKSTAIGHQYDAAYRHAASHRKTGGPSQQSLILRPAALVV